MKTSRPRNYVPAYHKLSDEAKVYEDFLHRDLAYNQAVTKLKSNYYCIWQNQNDA